MAYNYNQPPGQTAPTTTTPQQTARSNNSGMMGWQAPPGWNQKPPQGAPTVNMRWVQLPSGRWIQLPYVPASQGPKERGIVDQMAAGLVGGVTSGLTNLGTRYLGQRWGILDKPGKAADGLAGAAETLAPAAAGTGAVAAGSGAAGAAGAGTAAAGATPLASAAGAVPAAPEVVGAAVVPQGATIGGTAAAAAPFAGAAAGLHGAYNLATKFGDMSPGSGAAYGAETGAGIGTMILPGVGTVVGAGIGALGGLIASAFKNSGKDENQMRRDDVRDTLKEQGLVDDEWNIELGGTKFNIGKDGSEPYYQVGYGTEGFDPENPLKAFDDYGPVVGAVNPIAAILTNGDQKLTSDFAGYFTNAVIQAEDYDTAIMDLWTKAGITSAEDAHKKIDALNVDDQTKAAYHAAADVAFDEDRKADSLSPDAA